MTIDEMRKLDAVKTYKELEAAKKTNAELVQRMKDDCEYIITLSERCLQYHEAVLKYKEEIKKLTDKIEQLHADAEEQRRTIREIEELNEYLRQKNDKLEYGRTNK
jgi:uncharacterized coiled-coil DUF342 family protein